MGENLKNEAPFNSFIKEAQLLDTKTSEAQIREIVQKAEEAGEYRQAVIIVEEVLQKEGETLELRKKWTEKEISEGRFASAASELLPLLRSEGVKEKMMEIAKLAEDAGDYEGAHTIYYDYLLEDTKAHETLGKVAEKRIGQKHFAEAAELLHSTLGADINKMRELSEQAEAAGVFDEAIEIQKEYIEDEEKIKDLQKKWAESEIAKENYTDAAEIISNMKGRDERIAEIWRIEKLAEEKGDLPSAVFIRETILHDYNKETSELRRKMEETKTV